MTRRSASTNSLVKPGEVIVDELMKIEENGGEELR